MALFVVLAVLAGLLAVPVWRSTIAPPPSSVATPATPSGPTSNHATGSSRTVRVAVLSERLVLALALVGMAVTAALLFSLAMRPSVASGTRSPFSTARQEMGTLAKLAETSVAQGAELSRERDVRRRAEEDARLKQQLLSQSVDEKIRLGRDLHDGIIQSLYAVGLTLETLRPLLKADPVQAERRLEEIRGSLNATIRDVRSYITGLTPDNLRRASFSRAVAVLVEELRAGRSVQFEIDIDDDAAVALTVEQNVEALQIAREAISNALRHGAASQVIVRMHKGEGVVGLLVQDNGRGFDADRTVSGGHGLGNMRARAEHLGASLRVTSQPGQGARVIATFPCSVPNAV